MYAVIRTGGKQYRVAPGDVIEVEKLSGEAGEIINLSQVLMLGGEGSAQIGAPTVSGASVAAEVIAQKRGTKVIVFKKKRRKSYRRKRGHRQHLTALRITEILTGGKQPSKTAAKPAVAKKQATADAKKAEQQKPAAKPAAKEKAIAPAKKPAAKPAVKAKAKAPAEKPAAKPVAKTKAKAPARKPAAKKPAAKK